MTREDIIFLARVISDLDDLAERDAASRDFAATDHKTKGKFDQGDIRFGRLVFTAPKRLAPLGADQVCPFGGLFSLHARSKISNTKFDNVRWSALRDTSRRLASTD